MAALVYQLNVIGVLDYEAGKRLRNANRVHALVSRHRDVAPTQAATAVRRVHRAPERLTRHALAAARSQRLGLSVVAALLERDDDEQLWDAVMGNAIPAATAAEDIAL
jgi:hypothetical protein